MLFLLFFLNIIRSNSLDVSILLSKNDAELNKKRYEFQHVTKIYDLDDPSVLYRPQDKEAIMILTFNNSDWYLNGKKLKIKRIGLINEEDDCCIKFENFLYQGILKIQPANNSIYVTNTLDIEKYVAAVVAREFYSVWQFDSLKVAAIIIRTYAMHKILKTNQQSLYNLKSSISDQHYSGYLYNERILSAVQQTKGQIITWNKKPIAAMYHVCCGGVIPEKCVGFNFDKFPYLKRKKKCNGCQSYKRYEWQLEKSHDIFCESLSEFLNKKIVKIKKILNIFHGKSGTVRRVLLEIETLKNKKMPHIIQVSLTNKQIRKILNLQLNIHSAFFKLHFDQDYNLKIVGKGNGHHMGLCQIGMNEYIKNGSSIEEIIKFYYPETKISYLQEIIV